MNAPLVVTAVLVGLALVVGVWVALDSHPPEWDHANHLERAVECARDLAAGRTREILETSAFYPPLVPCAAGLVYRLWPSDAAAGQAVMVVFLGLGVVATYRAGRHLFDPTTAAAAAVLFATAPFVVFSALNFQLDLPLAALVASTLWVAVRADGCRATAWAVGAGVVFAVGLLTKPPFAVYALPPLVAAAWPALRERRLGRLAVGGLVTVALVLPWYGPRLVGLPIQVMNRSFKLAAEQGHPGTLTSAGLLFYPQWFPSQFGAIAAVLFVVGLAVAARRAPMLLASCLVPFAVFAALQNKNLRYTLPLLPTASLIAAAALAPLGPRARRVALLLLVGVGAVQVAATAFGVPPLARVRPLGPDLVLASPPSSADWGQRALLARVREDSGGAPVTVSVVPNYVHFSVSNFRYYAVRDGLPFRFTRAWDEYPLNVDYVVLKSGDQGPVFASDKARRVAARFAEDPFLAAAFPKLAERPLPDGTRAELRARRPPPVAEPARVMAARVVSGATRLLERFVADAVDLRVGIEYEDAALRRGAITRATLTARAARVGELDRPRAATLRVRDIRVVLDDLVVNPARVAAEGVVEPLALGRLTIDRLTLAEADLRAFVAGFPALRHVQVSLAGDAAQIRIGAGWPDLAARVTVEPGRDGRPFVLAAAGVRVGGVPVPDAVAGWIVRHWDPTPKLARLPVPVALGAIRVRSGVLEVGGGDGAPRSGLARGGS